MAKAIEISYEVVIPKLDLSGQWVDVAEFKAKDKAVQFIRERIGPCDEDGNINIIMEVQST